MQTYLCVVHPIYQEDEQALQTQTKKEREGKREGEKQEGGQSCYCCFLSYLKRSKVRDSLICSLSRVCSADVRL